MFFLPFKFLFFNFLNPHSKARKVKISIFLTLPYITLPDSYLMEDRPAYRYCVVLHALDTYLPAWSWASHHPWNNLHKLFLVYFSGRKRKLSQHQKKVKIKRPRTSFNVDQLSILEGEFHQNPYLTESRRKTLAQNLQLDDSQIKARIIYYILSIIIEKKLLAFFWHCVRYLPKRHIFKVFPDVKE